VSRRKYKYASLKPSGGINEAEEGAEADELLVARNVWAPKKVLRQRPGYQGVTSAFYHDLSDVDRLGYDEDNTLILASQQWDSGSLTYGAVQQQTYGTDLILSGFGAKDRWFVGFKEKNIDGVAIKHSPQSSNITVLAEYWDGSGYARLGGAELLSSGSASPLTQAVHHLQGGEFVYNFVSPNNWTAAKIDYSDEHYWLRFTIVAGNDAEEFSDDVILYNSPLVSYQGIVYSHANSPGIIRSTATARGLFVGSFKSGKRYVSLRSIGNRLQFDNMATVDFQDTFSIATDQGAESIPPTIAIIPPREEMYIAYGGVVTVHGQKKTTDGTVTNTIDAKLEDDPDFVGSPDGYYNPEYIISGLEDEWPESNIIAFHRNRLWCVPNETPWNIRWSAPFPYHRIWPTISEEPMFENDNSPVTAITEYYGNTVVFKQDSIWSLKYMGQTADDTDLDVFVPNRVVAGVGSVAHRSLQSIEGRILFLSEDGIYSFNGSDATKLSMKIQSIIDRINPSQRPFVASVHWRRMNCYLLSVALDESKTNNATICFDYRNNTWWLWDGFDVADWISDENQDDDEILYFISSGGDICQFDASNNDFGTPVEMEIKSHRMGKHDGSTRSLRLVEVAGSASMDKVDLTMTANDGLKGESSASIKFPGGEGFNTARFGAAKFPTSAMTRRRVATRVTGQWLQLGLKHSSTGPLPKIQQIDLGINTLGRR
jgi:hypothetical protein